MRYNALLIFFMLSSFTAVAQEHTNIMAKLKFYTGKLNEEQLSHAERLIALDSMIHFSLIQCNYEDASDYLVLKANELADKGNYTAAYISYQETCNILDSLDGEGHKDISVKKADCMIELAKMSVNLGFYNQGAHHVFSLLSCNNDKDINISIRSYAWLGLIFIYMDNFSLAQDYIYRAKEMLIAPTAQPIDDIAQYTFYNNYAGILCSQQEFTSALIQLEKADSIAHLSGDKDLAQRVKYNLANIYIAINEDALAINSLLGLLSSFEKTSEVNYLHTLAALNLGIIFNRRNNLDEALKYYQKGLSLATEINAKKIMSLIFIEMSSLYNKKDDHVQAYNLLSKGYYMEDSIARANNMEEIMLLTKDFEQREKKMEHDLLKQRLLVTELENKNKMIILAVLFCILTICVVLLAYTLTKLKKQRKNNLALNREIHSIQNETERKVRSSVEQLHKDIDHKNRELTAFTLMTVKTNEIVHVLKGEVKKLKYPKLYNDRDRVIEKMESTLNSYDVNQGWNEFRLYFEKVHPSFFIRLYEACKNLTQTEQRTCALIAINLSTKEIADLTFRSIRTIEAVIYQIRKKLNIPNEDKTVTYLQQYLLD